MRLTKLLTAMAGLFVAALVAGGPAAQADGCPSDQSVLDYSKNDPPYQCAVHYWSTKKSIKAWDSKSWSADTALGYRVESKCAYRSSKSDVSWTWAGAGPSYSATFTNWATSTRHFGTGVIFTTGSVNGDQIKSNNNCANGDGKITNSIKKITQKVTIDSITGARVGGEPLTISGTVSPSSATGAVGLLVNGAQATKDGKPVGGPIQGGKFTMVWTSPPVGIDTPFVLTAAYGGDISACPAAAKSCGYTGGVSQNEPVMIGKRITNNPVVLSASTTAVDPAAQPALLSGGAALDPVAGTSADGESDPAVTVVEKSARMPGSLKARCPSGTVPMHAELFGANTSRSLKYGSRGVTLKPGAVKRGARATIQVTCRKSGKSRLQAKRIGFGTPKSDRMSTRSKGSTLFGGPGADRLRIANKGGTAHGGLGADRITVIGRNSVATGGPGADVIRARSGGRTLLIGGPGRDRIVTSPKGRTLVDARDGQRDRVICRGTGNHVLADAKDVLSGNCHRH